MLDVGAEEVQRYVLVRYAGPAQRGPDGLDLLELAMIRSDQGSSVSFQLSLAHLVTWQVHVLGQLRLTQEGQVDFHGLESLLKFN